MKSAGCSGRVFFISVPKSGKNILYSFLFDLGFSRLPALEMERDIAVQCSYIQHCPALDMRGTFASPPLGKIDNERLASGMKRFLAALSTMPEGTVCSHHFGFHEELYDILRGEAIPIVFLYRDPRDCLFSMANYVLYKGMPPHFAAKMGRLPTEEVLSLLLKGDRELVSFASYLDCFRGWFEADGVLKLRFEDIIGPKGGGQTTAQIEHLSILADHIGWKGPAHQLARATLNSFNSQAGTFFKGQIGGWKEAFSTSVSCLFEKQAGHLLQTWGYQENTTQRQFVPPSSTDAASSLLEAMCREHEERMRKFQIRLNMIEHDSQSRLEQIHSLTLRLQEIEADSQARLAEIRKRDTLLAKVQEEKARVVEELKRLEGELRQIRETLSAEKIPAR
jgi:hypothetical protein